MADFYTAIDRRGSFFRLRGVKNGQRFKMKTPIEPYLFVKSKTGEYKSIYGERLEKIKFQDPYEAKQFVEKYDGVDGFDIHGMTQWMYPFLNDRYPGVIKYEEHLIRGVNFDIEVETRFGLPSFEAADQPIVSISAMKTNGDLVAWGIKDFDRSKDPEVEYRKFSNETALLRDFITWLRDWDPDYLTGWNIEGFDVPYMVRRIEQTCGEQWVKQLSPWGDVSERTIKDKFGERTTFDIAGVAILDYIQLYKKFTYTKQENYSLDFICEDELGEKKVDYKELGYKNLGDLYERDHQLFIEYNIQDVRLVKKLDDKMGLLSLVFSLAYTAKVEYNDTLGTVKLWDAIIHNHLMAKKVAVPQGVKGRSDFVDGAFVKEPVPGLYKWAVCFDLASLYPHLIMGHNISPETLVDYIPLKPSDVLEQTEAFKAVRERASGLDASVCGNGALFARGPTGFLPELMEKFYADRKKAKKEMLALERRKQNGEEGLGSDIARLHNLQMALKIALNSAYGALGNEWFRYFDSRMAAGITQSGFVAIQWVANRVNAALAKLTGIQKDYVIAMDTDSCYLNFEDIVTQAYKGPDDTNATTDWLDKVCEKQIQPIINKAYADLQALVMSPKQKLEMKREAIADKAVWVAKKRYLMNVIDSEGVRYAEPKLKVSGLESVRSSTPALVKDALKTSYKKIIEQSEHRLQTYIEQFRTQFMEADLYDIAIPSTANDLSQYTLKDSNIPYHVKASLLYNELLEKAGLSNELPRINNGDKIRLWMLTKANPLRATYIASPGALDRRILDPRWIDREAQYERLFLKPIASTIEPLNWSPVEVSTLESFFG